MTTHTGKGDAAPDPWDSLGAPDPGEHEDELGGPYKNDQDVIGGSDPEVHDLGGPNKNDRDVLGGPDSTEREDILKGPA